MGRSNNFAIGATKNNDNYWFGFENRVCFSFFSWDFVAVDWQALEFNGFRRLDIPICSIWNHGGGFSFAVRNRLRYYD